MAHKKEPENNELYVAGQLITFDLSKISHREYAHFWSGKSTPEEQSAFFQKLCGLSADQINELSEVDWRRFKLVFNKVCSEKIEDAEKNLQGEST